MDENYKNEREKQKESNKRNEREKINVLIFMDGGVRRIEKRGNGENREMGGNVNLRCEAEKELASWYSNHDGGLPPTNLHVTKTL